MNKFPMRWGIDLDKAKVGDRVLMLQTGSEYRITQIREHENGDFHSFYLISTNGHRIHHTVYALNADKHQFAVYPDER